MFDEQPDGDPHGECRNEIHRLTDLVRWAYGKLHYTNFTRLEDALKLDEMKLLLEHGVNAAGVRACVPVQHRITELLVAHRDMIEAQERGDQTAEVDAVRRMQVARDAIAGVPEVPHG